MLTQQQHLDFRTRGIIVVPNFLSQDTVRHLAQGIDDLHGDEAYSENGRWTLRGCLTRHQSFLDLLVDEQVLEILVQLLNYNIKLLGSQIVKLDIKREGDPLAVDWHCDGGTLSAELPQPLPQAFVKIAFCVSGSEKENGGELLMVPGSNCLMGDPVFDAQTGWPLGYSRVLTSPGDAVIFDWRTWHAVTRNSSDAIRRTLYFTYGYRWLSPMDYQTMPDELLRTSPIHWQLLGGSSELGNYLPSDDELPLKKFCTSPVPGNGKTVAHYSDTIVVDDLRRRSDWQHQLLVTQRNNSRAAMIARAIRDRTT